jgi:hypothetical protein
VQDGVELFFDFKYDSVVHGIFMRRLIEEGLERSIVTFEWPTDSKDFLDRLDDIDEIEPVTRKRDSKYESTVFYLKGCLVLLQLLRGEISLFVGGDERAAKEIERMVKEVVPEADERSRARISFWYWAASSGFARRVRRLLIVPSWKEIASNYPSATRHRLKTLMREGHDLEAGQLILWFGEPGCGKTYALRSLLSEWKDRFSFHFISDTDHFFANGDYLLSVMLDQESPLPKLFILEDAGEFLLPDARHQMGQGLSRLLNASDGLIGQGLNCVFLITTNEPVGRLHPAVSRPGRCAAQMEFRAFPSDEAASWLQARGFEHNGLPSEVRLADLYALTRGEHSVGERVKVGF